MPERPAFCARRGDVGKFEAAPFSISEGQGRLLLPEKALAIWEQREATSAMVQDFKACHFDRFMGESKMCFATVREFLMGREKEDGNP